MKRIVASTDDTDCRDRWTTAVHDPTVMVSLTLTLLSSMKVFVGQEVEVDLVLVAKSANFLSR